MDWRERLSMDPNACHGKPCITGARILTTLLHALKERGKRRGVASLPGWIALAALCGASLAHGGVLEGIVTTIEGKPLSEACCIYLSQEDREERIGPQITRKNGYYRFPDVEAGTYTIEVETPGFVPKEIIVRVADEERTKQDVVLQRAKDRPASLLKTLIVDAGFTRVVNGHTIIMQGESSEPVKPLGDPDAAKASRRKKRVDQLRIRLVGVEAPEEGEEGFEKSKRFVKKWLDRHSRLFLSIGEPEKDEHGNTLAIVYPFDTSYEFVVSSLNCAILKAGLAAPLMKYHNPLLNHLVQDCRKPSKFLLKGE
ncbi:MAG: carboxypeptidase regulatory-like domain-containing protein [Acidobacteriota bacterium]|nr:MAG: carboxypeptidase regulatory-like domain-containing protein [Acidobacteriota bacterium]